MPVVRTKGETKVFLFRTLFLVRQGSFVGVISLSLVCFEKEKIK
jgi:hypothetical protein